MKPFSRETVIDRRNPALKWTAVVAGTAVAIASWMLLQMFGTGVALCAFDARDLDRMRGVGIGTTAWSVLAPLIALFVGGMLAARLAGHHERRISGMHGMLVWAFTAIIGVVAVSSSLAMMSPSLTPHYNIAVPASDMNHRALMSASDAGTAFLVASLALALGLIAAIGGAFTAGHTAVRRRRRFDTMPGYTTEVGHTTAPYPTPTTERIVRED